MEKQNFNSSREIALRGNVNRRKRAIPTQSIKNGKRQSERTTEVSLVEREADDFEGKINLRGSS